MNGIARVTDVRFGLCHRIAVASESRDCSYARAMEAQMWKAQAPEKLAPFFGRILREWYQERSFLSLGETDQGHEVFVKRCGVETISFAGKADCGASQIDILQRDGRFRYTASLSHCHKPTFLHPGI